jgi:anti-anti-sigma factor
MEGGDVQDTGAGARGHARALREEAGAPWSDGDGAVRRAGELVIRGRTTAARSELVLEGELDLATVSAVEAALAEVRETGADVLVDLRGVTFLDSTAVRLLLEQAALSASGGGALTLRRPPARVARTLELAGVQDRLPFEA